MPVKVVTGVGGSANMRVVRDFAHLDDVTLWGENAIDYTSIADQHAKLQAILTQAGNVSGAAGALLLAGSITIRDELRWPTNRPVPIYGLGVGRSAISLTKDLGPGKFALRTTKVRCDLRDFTLQGPGGNVVHSGVVPSHTEAGLYTPGQGSFRDLAIRGFVAGVGQVNDHQAFHNVDCGGNAYGINFMDNPAGGLGDLYFERCSTVNVERSSIAICDTATVANAAVVQGHLGAPFGIWRYPAGTINCEGDTGSAVLSNVAIPSWFPISQIAGLTVKGMNIPNGTTVLSISGPDSTGFKYTLTLSAQPTGKCHHIYFPLHQFSCTGSVAQGPTLTNVNLPDWLDRSSITLGVGVEGPNIPAGTTVTSISGSGPYTLGLSQTPTGNVIAITFAPRGSAWNSVHFQNLSIEYCGHSVAYDEGRTRGGWVGMVFDTVGEFGTGDGSKWPGKPDPAPPTSNTVANYDVGTVERWHWRDCYISPEVNRTNQNYITADSIRLIRIDDCPSITSHRTFKIRSSAEGNTNTTGVVDVQAGQRGGPGSGIKHAQWCLAQESITKGALLETYGYNRVRESRNDAGSLICGFSAADYSAGEVVMFATQNEVSTQLVKNHSASPSIANAALIKPDSAHQGCVVAASSYTDGPILGQVIDGPIAAGALGRARVRV